MTSSDAVSSSRTAGGPRLRGVPGDGGSSATARRLRALIVAEDAAANEELRLQLELEPDIDVVAGVSTPADAVAVIEEVAPDLLFLEIGADGSEVVRQLSALPSPARPAILLVTPAERLPTHAFELGAVDCLPRPVAPERLRAALDRARAWLLEHRTWALAARFAQRLDQLEAESAYLDRIAVRSGGRFIFVRVEEVEWVEAEGNYVRLHCGERTYMIRSGINELEGRLSPRLFCRIHRSLLVRRDLIKEIAPIYQGEYIVVLENGTRLQSSRAYRGRIRQLISGAA
ncbi:MAG TPA: LytTR family DNA-binding domain-containing protein [Longimicrobiales bacterium]|nr:LytTR family DNA-binding domain-containing protein [Longimicrobiales bacterium]